VTTHDDPGLRARFRALAAEDQALAPSFEDSVASAALRRRFPTGRLAMAAAALLAIMGAAGYQWIVAHRQPIPYPVDLAAVTWEGPTDFLLATPGAALLRELPTIGTGLDDARTDPPLTDDTLGRNPS
jgi:hypothetical protein